jgi:hypothetical protein
MTLPLVARKSVLMIASLAVPAMLLAQDYPPDLSRGKAVYERHCLSCHGTSGRGDGPAAASLRVAPANFQRFGSFLKSDEELLRTIPGAANSRMKKCLTSWLTSVFCLSRPGDCLRRRPLITHVGSWVS